MPNCTLKIDGKDQTTEIKKISREDIYGDTLTRVVDTNGNKLKKAGITAEGNTFILPGDTKRAIKMGEAFTLAKPTTINNATGQPMEMIPSAFKSTPEFTPATTEEVNLFETTDVYSLPNIELPAKSAFKGTFNYRAGYDKKDALILNNNDGTFLLIGFAKNPNWISMEADSQLLIAEAEAQTDQEEGDFASLM